MPSGFNCLTRFDRCRLQALKKSGFPQRAVAAEISCPQSTAVRDSPATPGGLVGSPQDAADAPGIIETCLFCGRARGRLRAAQRKRGS